MTPRQRWMAALRCQPVDRLPFWPKIDAAYAQHQAEPFRRMPNDDLHAWIGSDRHVGAPNCVREDRSATDVEVSRRNGERVTLYHTPRGTLRFVEGYDVASHSYHPKEYPVKTHDDIETLRLVYADARVELDREAQADARRVVEEVGEDGIVVANIGISPLMDWIQHLAGIQNGLLWVLDYPERVETLFEAMHGVLLRRAEILAAEAPQGVIYSTENTSTSLISPTLFRRYCVPQLTAYGEAVRAAGKVHVLHMCGKLKRLLPDIAPLPASALEAFTSAPVGDTSLLDGRCALPGKCLIGGTNATLWLQDADTIAETIAQDVSVLSHRRGVVVTSAGVMPPFCRPEVIKAVCERVRALPAT